MRELIFMGLILTIVFTGGCAANSRLMPRSAAGTSTIQANNPPTLAGPATGDDLGLSTGSALDLPNALPGRRPAAGPSPANFPSPPSSQAQPRATGASTPPAARSSGPSPALDQPGAAAGATSQATASGIHLGEGDVIQFRISGQPNMATTSYISAQGTVSLPLLNQVHVGGLTPNQAQMKIANAYRSGGYFTNPQVNITITQYRSQQIAVLGEVSKPGRYPLETQTTVLDALAEAGGITPKGDATIVVIHKTDGHTQRYRLNLQRLVAGTSALAGFLMTAGDTIFVPKPPMFYIYGEVRRPDAYAAQQNMTVMQAIALGGGLTDRGSNCRIVIHRETADGHMYTFDPNLSSPVLPGDTIFVKERIF